MIGIYCIATGSYNVFIDGFLDSLCMLRPTERKLVVLFTDSDNDYKRDFIEVKKHRISDAPWPIVTLLKMWYINQYPIGCDEVFYFDIDTLCVRDLPNNNQKLMLTRHTCSNGGIDGHRFMSLNDDNPDSLSYIGRLPYVYVQGGFFYGDSNVVYNMCRDISNWIEDDLKRGIIPRWHDESYLNKWQVLNQTKCQIGRHMGDNCCVQFAYNETFKRKH